MPLTYTIDSDRRLILTIATGVLTDGDVLAHKRRLLTDPAFDSSFGELSDIRAVERLAVTTSGVSAMVAHDKAHAQQRGGHRMAIVSSEDVIFGMARMYQSLGGVEDSNVAVFRTMDDALAWLTGSDAASAP